VPDVVRFSVSTDERLLGRFDDLIAQKGYVNRSEAIRDLIRGALVEDALSDPESDAVGTVTLVYDHHFSDLGEKLTEHQHTHHESIVSTLHIHLDHHNCLEVVILKGRAGEIKRLADSLIGTKGVTHGRFVATTAHEGLA
jgi:CopG family nickel-responsive transcriptional regulator